jgi:tetratricopeptide (TPR) repeat protein
MSTPRFTQDLAGIGGVPFVLLAGAGLSLWYPTSLPTWGEFNQVLLHEAKARASRAMRSGSETAQAVAALTVGDIGAKALSNALVEMLAGEWESYFDVVHALDAAEPNGAHRAVAKLVRGGVIAGIVTTNFDTMIERALVEEGIAFVCYAARHDYRREDHSKCQVFKIHGSAGSGSMLIDTVGQKLRGLPPYVRARLEQVFRQHPVLVLGYSGGDLEFGTDYLALRCLPKGTDRIWWVIRPEDQDKIDPRVRDLVSDRGAFVLLQQGQALEAMGAGTVTLVWDAKKRAEVLEDLRAQVRRLYATLGTVNTLSFCMRLLSATGRTRVAAEIWQQVASAIDRRKPRTVSLLGPAMRALSAEGHRLFGVHAQQEWACRQLKDIYRRRAQLTKALSPLDFFQIETAVSAGARGQKKRLVRDVRSQALAFLAIGDSMVRRGKDAEAGMAIQNAMEVCEFLGDITLLPGVYRLYGWREYVQLRQLLRSGQRLCDVDDQTLKKMIGYEDTAICFLKAAEAAGLVAGNVDAMDSAWIRADLLVELGEYDSALLCLDRLEDRMGLGIHRETLVRIEVLRGEIAVRQGRKEEAMAIWNACLAGTARGNPHLEAYVKHAIVGRIGFAPEWRSTVLIHCDEILNAMERGELPTDARSDLVGTRSYFETVKSNLTDLGSKPLDPGFIQRLDLPRSTREFNRQPDYYARNELIHLEYHGEVSEVLHLLDGLVARYFTERRGDRALDAATAHVRRACRDGDEEQQFAALHAPTWPQSGIGWAIQASL